jgi:hypothetical protein
VYDMRFCLTCTPDVIAERVASRSASSNSLPQHNAYSPLNELLIRRTILTERYKDAICWRSCAPQSEAEVSAALL